MGDLFSQLVELVKLAWGVIYQALPLKMVVVRQGDGAVRFTFGRPGPTLGAGWWLATTGQLFEREHVRLRYDLISTMHTTLKDGTPLSVNGVFAYRIVDLGDFLTASQDSHELLSEFAEASLRELLVDQEWSDFHQDYDELDSTVRERLQKASNESGFGVEITRFRISSFQVEDASVVRALASDVLMNQIAGLDERETVKPGFMGKVALLSAAMPVNPVTMQEPETYYEEDEDL